jgi:hypothetical protein
MNSLKCLYLNPTSLNNKLEELKLCIESTRPDIIFVTETWFTENSIVNLEGYQIFRQDKINRAGGGVCIYVAVHIDSFEIVNDDYLNKKSIEQIWCGISGSDDKNKCNILLGCMYRPNNNVDIKEYTSSIDRAKELVNLGKYNGLLITGDLNLCNIEWSNGYGSLKNVHNNYQRVFIDKLNDNFLFQAVNFPTYQIDELSGKNTLDLILIEDESRIEYLNKLPQLGEIKTGHICLECNYLVSDYCKNKKFTSTNFNFRKANYNDLTNYFHNQDWNNLLDNDTLDADYSWPFES